MATNVEFDNPAPKNLGAGLTFDTGINARAFAQAKFAQFIAEPGLIVRPDHVELWKASGVREIAGDDGQATMVVWGPPVEGDRLDLLLNSPEKAVAAISAWIRAVLTLKNTPHEPPLWPCAATVNGTEVFFAPPALTRLCTMRNDQPAAETHQGRGSPPVEARLSGGEWYVHPDLTGMNAAAFTAAAMLYRVFAGTAPFAAVDDIILDQDMREGNFLPVRFAVPGLGGRLAYLIQSALQGHTALTPAKKKANIVNIINKNVNNINNNVDAVAIKSDALLGELIEILQKGDFVQPLAEADQLLLEKEKAQFITMNAASVKTKRFVARNTAFLLGCLAAIAIVIIVVASIAHSRSLLPTTAGMEPLEVVESYYNAIGDMDHQLMEACVTNGAGKNDIGMVATFFAVTKLRQSTEYRTAPIVVSARQWQEGTAKISDTTIIFGVTDLSVKWLAGGSGSGDLRCQADYILWVPFSDDDGMSPDSAGKSSSVPHPRSDTLTLLQQKGNWHIAEMQRTENF